MFLIIVLGWKSIPSKQAENQRLFKAIYSWTILNNLPKITWSNSTKCTPRINPTQYLPLLFTPENSALILQVGTYASEQQHPYTSSAWYTTIGEGTIPQYCKYVTLDKGIQIKQLVFVSS